MSAAFDPKSWVARFERIGGTVAWKQTPEGPELWAGVVCARPDRGKRGRMMLMELENHPEWRGPVLDYARDRLRH